MDFLLGFFLRICYSRPIGKCSNSLLTNFFVLLTNFFSLPGIPNRIAYEFFCIAYGFF